MNEPKHNLKIEFIAEPALIAKFVCQTILNDIAHGNGGIYGNNLGDPIYKNADIDFTYPNYEDFQLGDEIIFLKFSLEFTTGDWFTCEAKIITTSISPRNNIVPREDIVIVLRPNTQSK